MRHERDVELDSEGLHAALDVARKARAITWYQVGKETQVSASSLTWLGQGRGISGDNLMALLKWLGEQEGTPVASPLRFMRHGDGYQGTLPPRRRRREVAA